MSEAARGKDTIFGFGVHAFLISSPFSRVARVSSRHKFSRFARFDAPPPFPFSNPADP